MMYYPLSTGGQPRFGGLDEKRQLAFESGQAWFPGDYPGTNGGWEWELQQRKKRKDEWERRPKSKRVNWDVVDVGSGVKAVGTRFGNGNQFGKGAGSRTMKCFAYSEPRHRQSKCKKAGKRTLFAETNDDDNIDVVIKEQPIFNDEQPDDEEVFYRQCGGYIGCQKVMFDA